MMIKQAGLDPEKEIKDSGPGLRCRPAHRSQATSRGRRGHLTPRRHADGEARLSAFSPAPTNFLVSPISVSAPTRKKSKRSPRRFGESSKQRSAPTVSSATTATKPSGRLIAWGKVEREFAYASYDALRNLFNADGAVPEDGLKLVIDQARRNAKITSEVAPAEVADLRFLHQAQAELGIKPR